MDDNRIIIDNVNFNRNLPKWATDDTLNRLEKMVGKSHKESQKSLNDVLKTLKTISSKDADLFKETQTSNKAIKKELTKLTNILSQNNKTSGASKNTSEQTTVSKKTNVVLEKGFKTLDSGLDDVVDSILSGNSETSRKLDEANKAHDKVSEHLLKIYDEIRNISSNNTGNKSNNNNSTNNNNSQNNNSDQTNVLLGDIKSILSKQSTIQSQMYNRTMSDADFQRLMENSSQRTSDEVRDASRSTMGSLSDMLTTAINRVDRGQGTAAQSALTGTLATLAGTLGTLGQVLKMTPLGRMASVAMATYTVANKMFEYAYDVQSDFRNMIDRGFNFSQLSDEVGSDRLDGISMRRTILRNDIGLETATQILEKNTRLLNEVGFSSMFGELGNIVGDIDDPNSVTNRLGMTRDQVALIATDFYAMHRRINSITADFTAIERQNLAGQFVENVRRMSQQLGVGVPQIREAIEQFTNTERFTRTAAFMDANESQNVAMFSALLSNMDGLAPSMQEAMLTAATSVAGVFDPAAMEFIAQNPLALEAFSQFDEEFRNVRNMSVEELTQFLQDFTNATVEILDRNDGRDVEALSINSQIAQNIGTLSTVRSMQQQLNRTPSDLLMGSPEEVSPIAAAARELENMGILISARTEEMFASAADSAIGRETLSTMLSADEIMKRSQLAILDLTKDVVSGLFDGPIPTILRNIQHIFERVASAANWLTGRRHTDTITGNSADDVITALQNNILGSEAFESLFESNEEDGKTVYNIREGIGSEELNTFFSDMYNDANSREDREAIAGVVKSLSRGIEGNDLRIGDDVTDTMRSIEESFLGMATRTTSGEERERLMDAFSGFESSTRLFNSRLMDNAYDPNNSGGVTGFGSTQQNINEFIKATEALNNIELVDSNMVANIEALNRRRELNLNRERLERFQERQRTGQTIDRDVLNTINDMFNDTSVTLDDTTFTELNTRLERNSNNLDIEWINKLMGKINENPTSENEPVVTEYEDSTIQRPVNAGISATVETYRPQRLDDAMESRDIVQELRKQDENQQYNEQVRQAGENSFNEFTQNNQQNETINNTQDNTDIRDALAEINATQQQLAAGIDRNSRAIERYLATKT